jgi:hypothetical protein
LDDTDHRHYQVRVAGPAALIVAKTQNAERVTRLRPHRRPGERAVVRADRQGRGPFGPPGRRFVTGPIRPDPGRAPTAGATTLCRARGPSTGNVR